MDGGRVARGPEFSHQVFSAPEERCRRFTARVLDRVSRTAPLRILDIGCGNGAQVFDLARELPNATFAGVDISAPNIALASRGARKLGLEARIGFVACDYLVFRAKPQDVIISYSTLQLIPTDSGTLFSKIGSEIVDGGLLMNVMPYECTFNHALLAVRRGFASIRSPVVDAIVFRAAKIVHGARFDDAMLRERVGYMYQRLERLDGPALRKLMAKQCGLELEDEIQETHASLAQAKHRLSIFRKRSSAA